MLVALALAAATPVASCGGDSDRRAARELSFTVESRLVGRDLTARAVVPAGAGGDERRPHIDEYLRFYAREPARCRPA